jgi:hypothetical protein
MVLGLWNSAKANKENIFYTILTIFLLERVRRGWNRIESRGRAANLPGDVIERRQQWFAFRAALLYALLFLLPTVKYVYRSADELSQYVGGLGVLSSPLALVVVALAVEAFLAVLLFNLLGIYVERMNAALGFFRKMGRSVVDGSRLAVHAGRARVQAGASAGVRATENVGRSIRQGASMVGAGLLEGGRRGLGYSLAMVRRAPGRARRLVTSQLTIFK